jgi:Glycosyltransferase family 87
MPALVLAAVFAATRQPALELQAHDTDVNLYARYAAEYQAATRNGDSFYALHRRRVEEQMATSTAAEAAALAPYRSVEYPPLAVTFMTIPTWLTDALFDEEFPTGRQPRYAQAYQWLMVGCDGAVLLLVVFLVRRLFPAATTFEQLERCLVYVVCTWPLYAVLYTRLDLGVALLVTAALALLVSRCHWWLSMAVLAVAIHFKLMPAVLAPLWLIASLPVAALSGSWRGLFRGIAVRAAVLTGFGLALLAPYYLQHGPAIFEFLDYHKDRGIEIESTWATLMLVSRELGLDWVVYHSHGSVNVWSPWAPLLIAVATPALAGLLATATGLFVAVVWRRRPERDTVGLTIAQAWPRCVAGFTLLLLLISIAVNKVFSPQYLLWVLPLVPLVDFRPLGRRLFFAATLAMCFLTMWIFPDYFVGEIVQVVSAHGDLAEFDGPTAFGGFLLAARNLICLMLTAMIAAATCLSRWRTRACRMNFGPTSSSTSMTLRTDREPFTGPCRSSSAF